MTVYKKTTGEWS